MTLKKYFCGLTALILLGILNLEAQPSIENPRPVTGPPEEAPIGSKPEKICRDMCGNGECEVIVCFGSGCPCPESPATCPKDCTTDEPAR